MTSSAEAIASSLAAALSALRVDATTSQRDALLRYLALLECWNRVYNLTSLRDPARMLTHHLVDCIAAVPPLQRELRKLRGKRLIDVGSGAGLPGLVVAILDPGIAVLCVDTVGKKVAFMQQAAAELGLPNVRVVQARVEAVRESADVVTSRAFAPLDRLVATTRHLLDTEGIWMAMKGRRPDQELATLGPDIDVFHVEPLQVPGVNEERCLVWMRRTSR